MVASAAARTVPRPLPARLARQVWLAEPALLAVLLAVAAAVRWVELWTVPIFTDEGDEILLALRIARDGARPLTNDDTYLGPLFNYLLGAVFWAAGPSPWLPRLLVLALGALTALPAYLLARELALGAGAARRAAILAGVVAAALLAVNPAHVVVNSHVAWGNCVTPLLTTTAAWLLARGLRLAPLGGARLGPAAGLCLLLAAGAFGLALQTHPSVAALLPGAAVGLALAAWRRLGGWLRGPWPYLGFGALALGEAPTLLLIAHEGVGRWLGAVYERQAQYEGVQALDAGILADRLGRLLHALGAALGGLLNDRDTPLPPPWHPALLLALGLALASLYALWRRGQRLPAALTVSALVVLPLASGKYAPLVSNARYVMPLLVVLLATVAAAAAVALGEAGRRRANESGDGNRRRRALLPLAAAVLLVLWSAASLAAFYAEARRGGRTNQALLAALAALEAAHRPGEVVTVDHAMYRDWTLTEGRLRRVFEAWLAVRGIPHRVVDAELRGQPRDDLADRGGLAVLARKSVPVVARRYQVAEIAGDTAPNGPPGSGYSVVRLERSGGP